MFGAMHPPPHLQCHCRAQKKTVPWYIVLQKVLRTLHECRLRSSTGKIALMTHTTWPHEAAKTFARCHTAHAPYWPLGVMLQGGHQRLHCNGGMQAKSLQAVVASSEHCRVMDFIPTPRACNVEVYSCAIYSFTSCMYASCELRTLQTGQAKSPAM